MSAVIVLIGFMGAGKTETGRALSSRLGWDFADTDAIVESEAGMTIADIFAREGEAGFRDREARAVTEACAGTKRVIACGGGAILSLRNYSRLRDAGTIVYLEATPRELLARLGRGEGRPLLGRDPSKTLPRLLAERDPAYRAAADFVVSTDGRTPEHVAGEIEAGLAGRPAKGSP